MVRDLPTSSAARPAWKSWPVRLLETRPARQATHAEGELVAVGIARRRCERIIAAGGDGRRAAIRQSFLARRRLAYAALTQATPPRPGITLRSSSRSTASPTPPHTWMPSGPGGEPGAQQVAQRSAIARRGRGTRRAVPRRFRATPLSQALAVDRRLRVPAWPTGSPSHREQFGDSSTWCRRSKARDLRSASHAAERDLQLQQLQVLRSTTRRDHPSLVARGGVASPTGDSKPGRDREGVVS